MEAKVLERESKWVEERKKILSGLWWKMKDYE